MTLLSLAVVNYFNYWWTVLYVVLNSCLFIYKGVNLPYPPDGTLGWEITFIYIVGIIDFMRIFLADRGNKTHELLTTIVSIILSGPVLVMNVYYYHLQVYVLRLDEVINTIGFVFVISSFVLSIIAFLSYQTSTPTKKILM